MKKVALIIAICMAHAVPAYSLDTNGMKGSLSPRFSADQCIELLKECLIATDGAERNACMKDSADNYFCHGTPLGNLANKRWKLMAASYKNQESPPLPAEGKLVDFSCLSNFDSLLYAKLNIGKISSQEARHLSQTLDSCKEKSNIEIDLNRQ